MTNINHMDKNGFIWWYRKNRIEGNLKDRLNMYLAYIG